MAENFKVDYVDVTSVDNDTILLTSAENKEVIEQKTSQILKSAIDSYNSKRMAQSSVFIDETTNSNQLTIDVIDRLAIGINSTLSNVLSANEYILVELNTNDLFGLAYSVMNGVINTNYKLIYSNPYKIETTDEEMEEIRALIESFNESIDLEALIRRAISGSYREGNYILYLELNKNKLPQIQNYPLNICYPSYYMYGNDRVLEFNVDELKNRIRKTYPKTRKGKEVYYQNVEKEIEANYPKEVVDGFKSSEKLVRLDEKYGKCLTVNSFDKRFGVSPFFRALKSSIVVDNLIKADISNSKIRSKRVIFQKLSDKLLGNDGTRRGLAEQQLAHQEAAQALQTSSCLYTAPPFVESLEYVMPKVANTDSVNLMKAYNTKMLNALGISFYDSESATGTSVTVSYKGLLQIVNSIAESLSKIISRYYEEVLDFYNYERGLAPKLRICPAEELDVNTKMELAKLVYTTFNCSTQTALEYLGLDLDDEIEKRQRENDEGVYTVLFPRATSYTYSGDGDNESGRPSETNTQDDGKQDYDQNYNDNERN